jgi:hypothetical protein
MIAPDLFSAKRLRKLEALAARPGTAGEGAAARAAIERIKARFKRPVPPTIVGLRLILDRSCDRRHRCCRGVGVIIEGAGPHCYGLRCQQCGRHRGWLKATAARLLQAMFADGRLSANPTLRDAGVAP